MRAYLLILAGLPLVAQTETNIACVERLELPAYPALAKQARITGVSTIVVLLGVNALVQKISSTWTGTKNGGVFVPDVERSVRTSFAKTCAGKAVTLIFHFELGEHLMENQQPTVSFGYPNHFWITAPPMHWQP
jgi:hypothetical protein